MTCADAKDLTRLHGNACEQLRGIVSVQPFERSSQAVIVEIIGLDAWTQQMLNRFVGENCGTRYNRRLLNPKPFKIIATVAVPTLTCCFLSPASRSR